MSELETGTAQVVAELVESNLKAEITTVTHPTDGVTIPVRISSRDIVITSIPNSDFDAYREHPKRRTGTAKLGDLASIIAHVNRFKTTDSALFADPNKTQPGLLAVLDYHERVNTGAQAPDIKAHPAFLRHRAEYKFPLSNEWQAWNASNKKGMSQGDFAAFIEERVLDILPTPSLSGDELSPADQELKRLADLMNGKFAGPEKMMDLSRGLAIFESAKVINATNINSGAGTITYQTEHADGDGQPLSVPNLFLIGVPVFESGDLYRVVVRLRYRRNGGAINWFYELYRHDRVFDDAFRGACDKAQDGTGLPLFVGFPEV